MTAINPFDAADLTNYVEANHILNWYAKLPSDAMKQRCVDTIVDVQAVKAFIRDAREHLQQHPGDFDADALDDLDTRISAR